MVFIQWVIALAVLAAVMTGGAQLYRVTEHQMTQQQERSANTQQLVERYQLQQQLQRHRQFLLRYQFK